MNVGVLGSGAVGRTLAAGFADRGHQVRIGSRSPEKLADFGEQTGVATSTFDQVAEFGEVVVLAIAGEAAAETVELAGPERLADTIVIDTTNPLDFSDPGGPRLFVGTDDSLGERVQRAVPTAQVVKCFNMIGADHMVDPQFDDGPATMFIAGEDDAAKAAVTQLLEALGWTDVVDLGGIAGSRVLEPMALGWLTLAMRGDDRAHAFRLVS